MSWLLALLLLAPDPAADLRRALGGVPREGLSVMVGRDRGAPLLAVAPDAPRIPASNAKLLTAAAAVALLGEGFHFETTIGRTPGGALVVTGGGDPNLSGRFFDGDPARVLRLMARDVAAKGVREVTELLLDASRFDDEYVHPGWPRDQAERWYCAPVAALVYNDSCWDVTVYPRPRAGAAARVDVQPALLGASVSNRCETVAAGQHVVHVGRGKDTDLEVRGRILRTSAGITGHVAVRDPVLFFGRGLAAALQAEGVRVAGAVRRGRAPRQTRLVAYRSDLKRTLKVMLTDSQNLYAECTLKRLGTGSFAAGGEAVLRALGRLEVETAGVVVADGSGLARANRVTARALYGTLHALRKRPIFVEALAAGGEGTLRRRYRELGARVRAKTGTIRGVRSLSGYVTGRGGHRYVFVILANGKSAPRARQLQDRIVRVLAEAP
ncbi:MAG: D-alanyl-D-alanine carboxypeptidase/D-alanyl-D-alanine endopeptidase [Planctomycetota bacterium]